MTISDLLGPQLLSSVVLLAAPLLVAALGELVVERAGVLNLSIAGMVTLSASATFVVTYSFGSAPQAVLMGLVAGAVVSALIGLALAYFSVTLGAHQVTVGLGLLIFSLGAASMLYRAVIGISTTSVRITTTSAVPVPLLTEIPFIGPILFTQPLYVYAAGLLLVAVASFLFRTAGGRRLRAVGENPKSADTLGISVFRMRYSAVIVGSAIIGLSGAFYPVVLTGGFDHFGVAGRGWLALMIVIFGRWRPLPILFGALLFAYVDALQFRFGVMVKAIPPQFLLMLPYVLAIVALVRVYGRAEAPAALTKPYNRESRF